MGTKQGQATAARMLAAAQAVHAERPSDATAAAVAQCQSVWDRVRVLRGVVGYPEGRPRSLANRQHLSLALRAYWARVRADDSRRRTTAESARRQLEYARRQFAEAPTPDAARRLAEADARYQDARTAARAESRAAAARRLTLERDPTPPPEV